MSSQTLQKTASATPLPFRFKLRTLLRYELKNLVAGRGIQIALLLAIAAGLYAIYYGKAEMNAQRRVIGLASTLQRSIDNAFIYTRFKPSEDAGRFGYYLTALTLDEPSPWASLSIGQRDLNPYTLGVRLLGLYSQLFDSAMQNPLKALSGNFDLAFVVVFLFPLLVIGLSYNVISGEEDQGTLRLVRSLGTPVPELMAVKLAARFAIVFGLAASLTFAALAWAGIGLSAVAFFWLGVTALYLLFWFAVAFLVASLRRSSDFNATALLGAWLVFTVVIPAALNLAVTAFFPVPYAYEIPVAYRNEVNAGWDRPKDMTMQRFIRTYPEYRNTPPIKGDYAWKWYFAMQQSADDRVKTTALAYADHLEARQGWSRFLAVFSPPVGAQLMFNQLAQTDLDAHLRYLDAVKATHESLKSSLYPPIFNDEKIAVADLAKLRARIPDRAFQRQAPPATLPDGFVELACATMLVFALAVAALRRYDALE